MTTLTLHVGDALMERIAGAAQERGENAEQIVLSALEQAFRSTTPVNRTLDAEVDDILAPFWAEQDRDEKGGTALGPAGGSGDTVEAYLEKHWVDDLRRESAH